jgi:hypothetical protein
MKIFLKWTGLGFLFLVWLAFSSVLGVAVLSAKQALGINVFSATGYHAFKACLAKEASKEFGKREER